MPSAQKPMMRIDRFQQLDPVAKKELLGDGNYGGYYRPYYTRGWRDGYVFPLGRRWGAF